MRFVFRYRLSGVMMSSEHASVVMKAIVMYVRVTTGTSEYQLAFIVLAPPTACPPLSWCEPAGCACLAVYVAWLYVRAWSWSGAPPPTCSVRLAAAGCTCRGRFRFRLSVRILSRRRIKLLNLFNRWR